MKLEGNKIKLFFDSVGSGLVSKGEALNNFAIAGKDEIHLKADTMNDGKTMVVSSDHVKQPIIVRFARKIDIGPNFFNKEGLPAVPFRTDILD
jgi:sialate O-acetylesterase